MDAVDIVFSFDTTGSMSQCIRQVRRNVQQTVTTLLDRMPAIRIGLIAHGDYCDAAKTYIIKKLDLTRDAKTLNHFIEKEATDTGGGDWPECYELVLRDAQAFDWKAPTKRLVVIGDAVPHSPETSVMKLDWKVETAKLKEAGVSVFGVQCMDEPQSKQFFEQLARMTNGLYLQLQQFDSIVALLCALCYHGSDQLQQFETELKSAGQMTREVQTCINTLSGREAPAPAPPGGPSGPSGESLMPVRPGRFQICPVGDTKIVIKKFVLDQGLPFKAGRGFYELTKKEKITAKKEIILRSALGEYFEAKQASDLAKEAVESGNPSKLPAGFKMFVQSTSYNRVLMPNTLFLYEMDV